MDTRRNFQQAARAIEEFHEQLVRKTIPSGLRMLGEEIMTDVKATRGSKGVPRDLGTLAGTGRVEGPEKGQVTLSFGGAAAQYALYQHEELGLNHPRGEARYLVRGVERWSPDGSSARAAIEANAAAAVTQVALRRGHGGVS